MLELLRDIFGSEAGQFGAALALVILAFWLCHWVTKYLTRINTNHSNLAKSINSTIEHIDEIRRDISYVKGSLDLISRGHSDGYTQRQSPISLTAKGKEEVEKHRLDDIVNRNWETIYKQLEKDVISKNPYDIQAYCLETAATEPEKFFTQSDIVQIKELAFKKGLSLMTYTNILGVLIRDKYFKQKGMNIEDIDKHDPHINS